jgi:hypothetical protein
LGQLLSAFREPSDSLSDGVTLVVCSRSDDYINLSGIFEEVCGIVNQHPILYTGMMVVVEIPVWSKE